MDLITKNLYYTSMVFIFLTLFLKKASAVSCYECDSSLDMTCGETLADGHTIEPSDCLHLQEPQYCVKMTGLYEVSCLFCYQCDSSRDDNCPEKFTPLMIDAGYMEPEFFRAKSCDHVFGAQFCIKTTGLYAGELGTKRFCSARDFGNYCEMVRRPGDERLYRACVYTCSEHQCNKAPDRPCLFFVLLSSLAVALGLNWRLSKEISLS